MVLKPFFFALLLLAPCSQACDHLGLGTPKKSDFVQCREGYAIGYSYTLKSAEWVSYLLVGTPFDGVERAGDFREDPFIPEIYRTTLEDYKGSGFHRGHLANSESVDATPSAGSETFYLSNMTPQRPTHNTGIWKGLENRERKWALARGEVMVFTGPLFEYAEKRDSIGKSNVPIPTHYWKVIYDLKTGEAISFLIPHKNLYTKQLNDFLVSIDEIEKRAGIDLLSLLPNELEENIEGVKLSKQW